MANKNLRKLAINYGVTLGVISLLLLVIQYALGDFAVGQQQGETGYIYTGLSFVVGIVIVVIAMGKLKKEQGGYMRFGEGFKLGFSIYIYSAIIGAIFMLLYTLVLEPGYKEEALAMTAEQMYEANPNMTDEQVDMALSWTGRFMSPVALLIWAILGAAFMGAIISAIISAIMKKNPPAHMTADADTQTV